MPKITDVLQTRYNAVLASDSDPSFYKAVHAYVDYIVKTPTLSAIMEKSEYEYHIQHSDIWRERKHTDYEVDYQAALTYRLESLSLYAKHYVTLQVRIYVPVEEYIHPTPHLADKLDPVALLMLRGFAYTEKMGLWTSKNLKMHNKHYENQRPYYEKTLKSFHAEFLEVLEAEGLTQDDALTYTPTISLNPSIFIDGKKGIYLASNPQFAYAVEKESKRFALIRHLLSKEYSSVSELARISGQTPHVTIKAISEINRLFRKQLGQPHDLICHTDTAGYFLNNEKFEIEAEPNL